MRKIILGGCVAVIALSVSVTDADARRRHSRHKPANPVVRTSPKPVPAPPNMDRASVFDTQDWQAPVVLPGLMSVAQAAMAGSYLWEPENIFPPVKVEWVRADEFTSLDQALIQAQKPIIRPLHGLVWGLFGGMTAACFSLGLLAWRQNKERSSLT